MLAYTRTPVIDFNHPIAEDCGVKILIKREDLNHPTISGNKWWKLKYNIAEAINSHHRIIGTFGGAYSNHLFATASAAQENNLRLIAFVRGEETSPLNSTVAHVQRTGSQIVYLSRDDYRRKNDTDFIQSLQRLYGNFFLIPEGGTNEHAITGVAEFAQQELMPLDFNYLVLPVGTGGTLTGVVAGLQGQRHVIGVSALKGSFHRDEITKLFSRYVGRTFENWEVLDNYHFGGYAKTTEGLLHFIQETNREHQLPLEHVYTGKMIMAIIEEIQKGRFEKGSTILALHTGGLQIYGLPQ